MQIKQAFRQKSLQCHPDLCPPAQRESAEAAFREVAEAYSILSKGKGKMHHEWLQAALCRQLLHGAWSTILGPWALATLRLQDPCAPACCGQAHRMIYRWLPGRLYLSCGIATVEKKDHLL